MEFILKLLLVLFLVLLNGFFVASEFALVGVRRTRIDELVKKGSRSAKQVKKSLEDLDSYISSTQLGITIASLALGWVGEPAVAHFIQPFLTFIPENAARITSHTIAVLIAFSFITFLHIVLGELAPKSIALQAAENTSLAIIGPLRLFTKIFRPFIWVLNGAGATVLKIFGFTAPAGHQLVHSEEEIKLILSHSQEGGAIEKEETKMLYNVFKLSDIAVKQIMIPRTEIVGFSVDDSIGKINRTIKKYPYHSRFPVFKGTIDNIVGFIHVKDLYKVSDRPLSTHIGRAGIIRTVLFIPEIKKADDVFIEMRKKRTHMAVVNDEFGGTAGLVTMEDIIESLVGEIEDEFDNPQIEIKRQRDGSFLVDGRTSIEDIRSRFKFPLKGQGYTTIGGLVFGLIGREPAEGEKIQLGNLLFAIEKVEHKRIKSLIIRKVKGNGP